MSSIRSILEKITARSYCTGQDGQPYNVDEWQIDQALKEIKQIVKYIYSPDPDCFIDNLKELLK